MLADGGPESLAAVEEARPEFTGVLPDPRRGAHGAPRSERSAGAGPSQSRSQSQSQSQSSRSLRLPKRPSSRNLSRSRSTARPPDGSYRRSRWMRLPIRSRLSTTAWPARSPSRRCRARSCSPTSSSPRGRRPTSAKRPRSPTSRRPPRRLNPSPKRSKKPRTSCPSPPLSRSCRRQRCRCRRSRRRHWSNRHHSAPPEVPLPPTETTGGFAFEDLLKGDAEEPPAEEPPAAEPPVDLGPEAIFMEPLPPIAGERVTETGSVAIIDQAYEVDAEDDAVDEPDRVVQDLGPVSVDTAGIAIVPAAVHPPSGPISTVRVPADETVLSGDALVKPKVFTLEAASLEPTPAENRVGRAARLFWLWFAANASPAQRIGLGAAIFGLGMSLRQSIVAALAGVALSFFPLGLSTLAGKRSGQPTMVVSRATFGLLGNIAPSILSLISRLFWARRAALVLRDRDQQCPHWRGARRRPRRAHASAGLLRRRAVARLRDRLLRLRPARDRATGAERDLGDPRGRDDRADLQLRRDLPRRSPRKTALDPRAHRRGPRVQFRRPGLGEQRWGPCALPAHRQLRRRVDAVGDLRGDASPRSS